MTGPTGAPWRDDAVTDGAVEEESETIAFGYRGEQFEVRLDAAGKRQLDAVLQRYIAAGRRIPRQ